MLHRSLGSLTCISVCHTTSDLFISLSESFLFLQTWRRIVFEVMDTAIDLSDASKALDLANIRFQLVYGLLQNDRVTRAS